VTEREKMLAGEVYDPMDPDLVAARRAARAMLEEFNADLDEPRRMALLAGSLSGFGAGSFAERPLRFDYGTNITIGRDTFLNYGVVILDCAEVRIGDRVNVAPNVQLLTADHPREPQLRAQGIEFSKPVSVGDDVWLGAGAILCPGVSVGDGSIVGAGSVVTRDVPAGVLAAGNPCRVVRQL
jgi:maltose O-acetyltransferase